MIKHNREATDVQKMMPALLLVNDVNDFPKSDAKDARAYTDIMEVCSHRSQSLQFRLGLERKSNVYATIP